MNPRRWPILGNPTYVIAVWLFGVSFLFYLSTAKAVLEYGDDLSMLEVTRSLVVYRDIAVAPGTPGSAPGLDGRSYSKYGLGQSLLAAPLYIVGLSLLDVEPRAAIVGPEGLTRANALIYAVCMLGLIATAATVATLYLVCREMGNGQLGSIIAAFALGFGTFAWHYSRTFLSEPASMLCCLVTFYGIQRFSSSLSLKWLLVSGFSAGGSFLLRGANVVLLAPIAIWLGWLLLGPARTNIPRVIAAVVWSCPILAAVVLFATYNFVRFGSALETGYGAEALEFTTPIYVGLYGLLVSSGKGIFLYAPILTASVVGWLSLWKRARTIAIVTASVVVIYIAFYSRFYQWYGGGTWGPRFLVVILPFAVLGLAELISNGLNPVEWLGLGSLGAVSVFIQVVSVLVPYVPYEGKMESSPELFSHLLWDPKSSPLVALTASLLHSQYPWDVAPHYYSSAFLGWLQVGAFLTSVGLLFIGVAVLCSRDRRLRSRSSNALPTYSTP